MFVASVDNGQEECSLPASCISQAATSHSGCRRQGKEFEQSYQQGKPITELTQTPLPKKAAKQTGTQIRFLYDKKVFSKG